MSFMTITARKGGACKRCKGPIEIGQKIRWSRQGGSYHMAAECPASEYFGEPVEVEEALAAAVAEREALQPEPVDILAAFGVQS